ncbi:MAG: hypothetical protein V3R26_01595 [Hyphomicrobium sp.]
MAIFDKDKSLLEKAKEAASRVKEKSLELVSDEKFADLISKAVEKQEAVNDVLQERDSNYRISSIDIEMGLPPKIIFGVKRIADTDPLEVDAAQDSDSHDLEA